MHNDPIVFWNLLVADREARVRASQRKRLNAAQKQARRDEERLRRARAELDRALATSEASRARLAELVDA